VQANAGTIVSEPVYIVRFLLVNSILISFKKSPKTRSGGRIPVPACISPPCFFCRQFIPIWDNKKGKNTVMNYDKRI
jgi:hypothetical protein